MSVTMHIATDGECVAVAIASCTCRRATNKSPCLSGIAGTGNGYDCVCDDADDCAVNSHTCGGLQIQSKKTSAVSVQ